MTDFNVSETSLSDFRDLLKRAGSDIEVKPSGTVDWALTTHRELSGSVNPDVVGVDKEGNFHILRDAPTNSRTAYQLAPVEVLVQDGKVSIITKADALSAFEVVSDPKDARLAPIHEITVK